MTCAPRPPIGAPFSPTCCAASGWRPTMCESRHASTMRESRSLDRAMNTPPPPLNTVGPSVEAGSNVVGASLPHDSADLHVSGTADYTDDLPEPRDTLHVALGVSPVAHGRLKGLDLDPVRAAPGVIDVIVAADIPGENDVGPIQHDDPIFAEDIVQFAGQPVFAVAATSVNAARRAARLARFDIEALPAILSIDDAIAAESYVLP